MYKIIKGIYMQIYLHIPSPWRRKRVFENVGGGGGGGHFSLKVLFINIELSYCIKAGPECTYLI